MGCEMSKQLPAKKRLSSKRVTRKLAKAPGVAIGIPISPAVCCEGSASGTTHSGDSPADLGEVRTFSSNPDVVIDKHIPESVASSHECLFDDEVLEALAQVDEEHKRRKETEFRAILRGVVKSKVF